jgi:hypothetical protein
MGNCNYRKCGGNRRERRNRRLNAAIGRPQMGPSLFTGRLE